MRPYYGGALWSIQEFCEYWIHVERGLTSLSCWLDQFSSSIVTKVYQYLVVCVMVCSGLTYIPNLNSRSWHGFILESWLIFSSSVWRRGWLWSVVVCQGGDTPCNFSLGQPLGKLSPFTSINYIARVNKLLENWPSNTVLICTKLQDTGLSLLHIIDSGDQLVGSLLSSGQQWFCSGITCHQSGKGRVTQWE